MSEYNTNRTEAAKLTAQIADHLSVSQVPSKINWLAILELIMQILPIILAFLAEDTDQK